jgi:predicted Zn-dependent peptidase
VTSGLVDERLPNGLRLVVAEDHTTPAVAVTVTYGAGTRDEGPGEGELAHLFEHMMFEGSANVGPGEHLALLLAAGGAGTGITQADCTTFASVVPSNCVELLLWLEAERLANLPGGFSQESLDRQRAVVRNEHRQRRVAVPYGSALSDLAERLYPPGHPYHTSMRRRTELEGATLGTVEAFFRRYYVPGNAVVAVCGDVDVAAVREWVGAYFGPVPAAPVSRCPVPVPRPLPAEVRETVEARVPRPRTYLGWLGPADGTSEFDALALAVTVLGAGEGCRLRRAARDGDVLLDAGLAVQPRAAGASLVHAYAIPAPGVAPEVAERAVLDVLLGLAADPPTEAETARAVLLHEHARLHQVAALGGRARTIATDALLHDRLARPAERDVEPAAIAAAAARVLGAHPVVRTFLPAAAG